MPPTTGIRTRNESPMNRDRCVTTNSGARCPAYRVGIERAMEAIGVRYEQRGMPQNGKIKSWESLYRQFARYALNDYLEIDRILHP